MSQRATVAVVYVLALFVSVLDVTIVNVALPAVGREFGADPADLGLVSVGYLTSLAVVIPASGWLGDRFGGKRVLLTAVAIFTAGSAGCGVAGGLWGLVTARVVQGVGGGLLTPVGMAMLYRVFPSHERVRVTSVLAVVSGLAPILGPVLGGALVTSWSWRWVFLVNVPFGVVALLVGLGVRNHRVDPGARLDALGLVLSGLGLAALVGGLSEGSTRGWSSAPVVVALALAGVLLAALVVSQQRSRDPLLRLRLLSDRLFRASILVILAGVAGFYGVLYVLALYLQDGLGLSALEAGLAMLPEAIGVLLGAQLASRVLYPWLGPRRVVAGGLLVTAVATGLLVLPQGRGDLAGVLVLLGVLGLGWAQVYLPASVAAFARISDDDTARASTLYAATRQLGGALGIAALVAVMGGGRPAGPPAGQPVAVVLAPFRLGFVGAVLLLGCAAVAALTIRDADADSTRPGRGAPPSWPRRRRLGRSGPSLESSPRRLHLPVADEGGGASRRG